MSYAQKTRGYRKIIVDGQSYRWRFDTEVHTCSITLQHGTQSGQQAVVTLTDICDPWLAISDGRAKPFVITPRQIPPLIRRALAQGWRPADHLSHFNLTTTWEEIKNG